MGLFGGTPTVDVQHVTVTYKDADGDTQEVSGWVTRLAYPGEMVAFEWYDPENPDARNRQEIGARRISTLTRDTEWKRIEKGAAPPREAVPAHPFGPLD